MDRVTRRAARGGCWDADILSPPDADPDEEWREHLLERMATVRGFVLAAVPSDRGRRASADAALAPRPRWTRWGGVVRRPGCRVTVGFIYARRIEAEAVLTGW